MGNQDPFFKEQADFVGRCGEIPTHVLKLILFWTNFRLTKCCKNSRKIFLTCFTLMLTSYIQGAVMKSRELVSRHELDHRPYSLSPTGPLPPSAVQGFGRAHSTQDLASDCSLRPPIFHDRSQGHQCSVCGMSINSDLKWFLSIFFRGHEVIYLILGGVYSVSSFLYKETLPQCDLTGKAGGASTGSFQCVWELAVRTPSTRLCPHSPQAIKRPPDKWGGAAPTGGTFQANHGG